MKKFLTVVVASAALSLTGCSMLPGSTPQPTVTVTQSAEASKSAEAVATPSPSESADATASESSAPAESGKLTYGDFLTGKVSDDTFVALVRSKTTSLGDVGDGAILLIPGKACAELGNGGTLKTILMSTGESIQSSIETKTGAPATYTKALGQDAGYIVGAGVMNYCPQYAETLKAQLPEAAK